MKYRLDIQGLRAIAFLLVFIFHINPSLLPGGFIGVDIFFVISGYLITTISMRDIELNKFSLIDFYEKRIKRLFPAYFIMIATVAVLGGMLYLYSDLGNLRRWLLSSLIFCSNIVFGKGQSYFGVGSAENPLLHTWSLAIEMQFYLFLPLLLICVKRKYLLFVLPVVIIVISILTTYQVIFNDSNFFYYSLITRTPEFFVGVFLAMRFKKRSLNIIDSTVFGIVSVIIIFLFSLLYKEAYAFPGLTALIPCLACGILLISNESSFVNKILSNKLLVFIGELSYSLYLWHWPIMAFFRYSLDTTNFTLTQYLLIIGLTLLFGYTSYILVESKFRKSNIRFYVKCFSPIVVVFVLYCLFLPKLFLARKIDVQFSEPSFGLESDNKKHLEVLGDVSNKSGKKVIFFGDSNALALKVFFDYLGNSNGFSFSTLSVPTYLPLLGLSLEDVHKDPINSDIKTISENLKNAQDFALFLDKYLKDSDIIIINATRYDRVPSQLSAVSQLIKGVREDQKLILINTFPVFDKNPIRINRGIDRKSNFKFTKETKEIPYELIKEIEMRDNVFIYDISKSIVLDNSPYYNNTVIYYDKSHINNYGALLLAKDLEEDFKEFWTTKIIK